MATTQPLATVKIDPAHEARVNALLKDLKISSKTILARALNETGNRSKTVASSNIQKDIRLAAAKIKSRLIAPKDSPVNKATSNRLTAKLSTRVRGFRLYNFKHGKQPQLGTPSFSPKVKVKPTGQAKKIPGAFLLKLQNTSLDGADEPLIGLFVRTNSGQLKHLYGPSVSQVYSEVKDEISNEMQGYLQTRVDAGIEGILRRFGKAA